MTALILIVFALTILQPRCGFGESYTAFVKRNLQQLCPYSDFCSHKAIDTLSKNQSSCCLPCSCEVTCRSHGNCCPDYEHTGETTLTTELEPCIPVLEDGMMDSRPTRKRYNGVNDGINLYHTVMSCPTGFADQQTINKCTSSVPQNVVEAARVSNRKGQVYRNRYCAICHGVTDYITWELQMTYSKIHLEEEFTELNVSSLLENGFKFQSIPPATHADFLMRCYMPEFTVCNQTGKWDAFNNYTYKACNSLTNAYIVEDTYTALYKNPFCYLCNKHPMRLVAALCQANTHSKFISKNFAALIDLGAEERKQNRLEVNVQQKCREFEIFDQNFGVCRRLLCPITKYPFYGQCQDHFKNAQGMSLDFQIVVNISYANGSESEAITDPGFMNTNENARLLTDAFLVNSGFSTTSCTVCTMSLTLFVEGHPDVDHLLVAGFSTNEHCFVDDVLALMGDNLNRKSFQISVDNITIIVTTRVAFPLQSFSDAYDLQSSARLTMLYNRNCITGGLITNPKFHCPHIDLLHQEYIQYVFGNITGVKESSADFSMSKIQDIPGNENGTVYKICIKDYRLQKAPSVGNVLTSNTMILWLLGLPCVVMALIM